MRADDRIAPRSCARCVRGWLGRSETRLRKCPLRGSLGWLAGSRSAPWRASAAFPPAAQGRQAQVPLLRRRTLPNHPAVSAASAGATPRNKPPIRPCECRARRQPPALRLPGAAQANRLPQACGQRRRSRAHCRPVRPQSDLPWHESAGPRCQAPRCAPPL